METPLKSQEQLKKELSAPLPAKAITKHPTKTYLSSIKAIYVTERLNDVFGIGKWRQKVRLVKEGDKGMIVVKVILTVPEYGIYYESFGGNDNGGENNKNFDLGDAFKGATTDALTKIGSYMGIAIDVFKGNPNAPETPQPKQEPISYPADIKKSVSESNTVEALTKIWNANKPLHGDENFKNDVMKRKLELLP